MNVVGFGALNVDEFLRVDTFSKGEKVVIKSRELHPGGAAANTIVGLSRLGIETGLIGALGKDNEGKMISNHLTEEGVDLHGIMFKEGRTGRATCVVDRVGEHVLFIDSGVNDLIEIADIDLDWLEKGRILHMTSFGCVHSGNSFETQKG